MTDRISIMGVSIERMDIEISRSEYEQAKRDDRLDHELDVYLSDMDSQTLIIEPDGTVISPYGGSSDLMELIKPILNALPTHVIEQYAGYRTYCDEVGEEPEA